MNYIGYAKAKAMALQLSLGDFTPLYINWVDDDVYSVDTVPECEGQGYAYKGNWLNDDCHSDDELELVDCYDEWEQSVDGDSFAHIDPEFR